MITSTSKRFHFIHIPKTGGSSFTWNYRGYFDKQAIDAKMVKGFQMKFHQVRMHSTYLESLAEIKETGFFSFAMVRNPWARIFSSYTKVANEKCITKEGFNEFLKSPPKELDYFSRHIAMSQANFVCDKNGNIGVDRICRFEEYDKEMRFLEAKLDIHCDDKQVANASLQKKDYREYYTQRSIDLVKDVCSRDIELFNYVF